MKRFSKRYLVDNQDDMKIEVSFEKMALDNGIIWSIVLATKLIIERLT